MFQLRFLHNVTSFAREFERCCREYKSLDFATAWCGDPRLVLPYSHLETFTGPVRAIVGNSFNHTHPDGIEFLRKRRVDLRVFRDGAELFHPKLYLFSAGTKRAIFVGSSNLTYCGFYCNEEINVLLEGVPSAEEEAQVEVLESQFDAWRSDRSSFVPSDEWIADYRKEFAKTLKREKKHNIKTISQYEDLIASASWLRNAPWETYWKRLSEGLQQHNRNLKEYHGVLAAAAQTLSLPWRTEYFDDLESRRIIGGIGDYGWLGHVAASGRFQRLLARGSKKQRQTIVGAINAISKLSPPIDWAHLDRQLQELCKLGPTMKVWSRVLCLVRPDLYCTIASISVRKNLSRTLGIPQTRFQAPDGYIELAKLVHASPWFQAPMPMNEEQAEVWKRRAAFMDGILYE